jgi:hypothetical protein
MSGQESSRSAAAAAAAAADLITNFIASGQFLHEMKKELEHVASTL